MQEVIVIVLVIGAAFFLFRRMKLLSGHKDKGGCDDCH